MFLKKITLYHAIPAFIAALVTLAFAKNDRKESRDLIFPAQKVRELNYIVEFRPYELKEQVAFSVALKQRIPVLLGSSELTAGHLKGLAHNFFNGQRPQDRFLSLGHQGFQNLGMLTVLAANKPLLKKAKLTIILSPGWFEKQYCKGTSLKSFFEYGTPNYLYQIQKDTSIDKDTKEHLSEYIRSNFDKISSPDATLRLMGRKKAGAVHGLIHFPFNAWNRSELKQKEKKDLYLVSQEIIVNTLVNTVAAPYRFVKPDVNWDSLMQSSKKEFKKLSNNNSLAVENTYYDTWLKNKRKKRLVAVAKERNQEFKDLQALVHFLKAADCNPLFVIMPLNTKAHEDLSVLKPIIHDINTLLKKNDFKTLDMFTPNLEHYEDGVLEDIMHPYDLGWYQIDQFILNHYHDQ